ncbi:MAG: DUF3786 domain-containing protein [Peptococcaceae bacterium]|nr:DUF3786 domain-containing protein [Peptococcaceae bacterium]
MCNPVNAYHEAVKRFRTLDPGDAAARSGARYDRDRRILEIMYFGSLYMVNGDGAVWRADDPSAEVSFNDRTLIVQYLCESSGLPPRGAWLSFLELPDGSHHYMPFQTDAAIPLAGVFGRRPEEFDEAARALGGRPLDLGDRSFLIPALPKIPLAVVIWEEDDEFPAKSNILFDSVSPLHLTTAALWVLGVELARKMIAHYDREAGRKREITWLEGVKRD